MRKYAVVLVFLLVVSGCGGSSDTATPATTVAPAATQAPTTTVAPTTTAAPTTTVAATATVVPVTTAAPTTTVAATTTVVPATTVAPTTTAAPTTTVAATTIVAPTTTVAATTTAAPTTTSASSSLVVSCVLDADQEMILCEAENLPQSGSLKWTSNATTQWQYGPQWDFALGEVSIPAITQVSLENCQESDCQVVSTTVDTSALVSSVVTDPGAPSTTTSAPSAMTVPVPDPPLLQRLPVGPFGPYDPASNTSGVLSLNADRLLNGEAATFPPLSEYGRPLNESKLGWEIGFNVPGDTLVYVPLDSTVESFGWHDSGGLMQSWDDWSIRLKPISDQRPPAPEGHAPDSFTWLVEIDHLVSLNCPRPRVWPDRCDRLPIINGVELHSGMILEEGQVLGYVGHLADYASTGLNGHVEMQINYTTDDWRLSKSYCPLDFLTGTARATVESEWNDFMAAYETWAGDSGVYDEEKMITPGCRYLRADHFNDGSEFGLNTPFAEPE